MLSRSKCRHIQSFLQRAKANALRLNELLHAELLSMAALTPAQLVIKPQPDTPRLAIYTVDVSRGEKSPALDLALPV